MPILNPFIYGKPVPVTQHINRQRELRTLFSRLRNGECTAVVGEPHIGKSSLCAMSRTRKYSRNGWGRKPHVISWWRWTAISCLTNSVPRTFGGRPSPECKKPLLMMRQSASRWKSSSKISSVALLWKGYSSSWASKGSTSFCSLTNSIAC